MASTRSLTVPPQQKVTRQEAIDLLRNALAEKSDDDHSACAVAAEHGIMCRGFKRYSDAELRKRYFWLADRKPGMTRAEIEDLANRWQLARQLYHDLPCSCDVQQIDRDVCSGWDSFSNGNLQRFLQQIAGIDVVVT